VCRNETRWNWTSTRWNWTSHEWTLESIDRRRIRSYPCQSELSTLSEISMYVWSLGQTELSRKQKHAVLRPVNIPSSDSTLQPRRNAWFTLGRRTSQRTVSLFMRVNRNWVTGGKLSHQGLNVTEFGYESNGKCSASTATVQSSASAGGWAFRIAVNRRTKNRECSKSVIYIVLSKREHVLSLLLNLIYLQESSF